MLLQEVREGSAVVDPMEVTFAGGRTGFDIGLKLEVPLGHLEVVEQGDGKGVDAGYTRGLLCHYKLMSGETKKKPRHLRGVGAREQGRGGDLSAATWIHGEMTSTGVKLLAIKHRRYIGDEVRPWMHPMLREAMKACCCCPWEVRVETIDESFPASQTAPPMQKSITISPPSFRSLFIQMAVNGNILSSGTAFVVMTPKGPHLITNRHNVTGRSQIDGTPLCKKTLGIPDALLVWQNRASSLGHWVMKPEALYHPDGQPRWHEHPVHGEKADFVALPLTDLTGIDLHCYDMVNTGPAVLVSPASAISVVGFPFGITVGGFFAVWATGFVASEPEVDFEAMPVFLIDCRSRQGQSGSPVISHYGGGAVPLLDGGLGAFAGPVTKFHGIYSGRINEQSDLGVVWKAAAIAELIASL